MHQYCPNCGRELEDGEFSYGIDGCMYCINMDPDDESANDPFKNSEDLGPVGSLIVFLAYLVPLAFVFFMLYLFFKPLFD